MFQIPRLRKPNRTFLFIGLAWIMFWVIPWGKIPLIQGNLLLAFLTEMLRLGLALALFIVPGTLLYLLLTKHGDERKDSLGFLPIGFALSVAIIETIGLLGRMAGFSFDLVSNLFAIIGALEIGVWVFRESDQFVQKNSLEMSSWGILKNSPLLFALVLVVLLTFNDLLFFNDDTIYGAYVTNWQYSNHLGFQNIIHFSNTLEHVRFWLAMFPMSQSLLARLSGIPGLLLLGNYLELFLTPLAILTLYWLLSVLGLSPKAAGFSVLIQVALFSWIQGDQYPVGMWFFRCMSADKVAAVFLLSPVFFVFALNYVQRPAVRKLALVFVCGLGLMLTHPIILFLACAIAEGMVLFAWTQKQTSLRTIIPLTIVFLVLMSPHAVIRLSDKSGEVSGPYDGGQAASTFEIEKYTNIVGEMFYGLNPGVLEFFDIPRTALFYTPYQSFRAIPIIFLFFGGILFLINIRRGSLYWYLSASTLLVLFAALPYTGWILGYFVSARMISRAAWFAPLGASVVLVVQFCKDWFIKHRFPSSVGWKNIPFQKRETFLGLLVCMIFVVPPFFYSVFPRIPTYFQKLDHNQQLAQVGVFIDKTAPHPVTVMALVYSDIQLLPTVSAHANLISFREEVDYNGLNNFMSVDEIHERMYASNTIRSLEPTAPAGEKCRLIQKYKVKYLIAAVEDAEDYRSLVRACGLKTEVVFETRGLVLLEFKTGCDC